MASTPSILRPARPNGVTSLPASATAEFLTSDIIRYLSKRLSVPESGITPHTRLAQDLGMTSDDALDFFEAFASDYNVNLDSLFTRHWQRHFGGQGMSLDSLCAQFLCAAPAGFLAGFGASFEGWLLYGFLMLLWFVGFRAWPFFRRCPEGGVPIRVRDLAVSIRLGRWYEVPNGKSRPVLLKRRAKWAVPTRTELNSLVQTRTVGS